MKKSKVKQEKSNGIYVEHKVKYAEQFYKSINRYTTLYDLEQAVYNITGQHTLLSGCGQCLVTKLKATIYNYYTTGKVVLDLN